MLGTLRARVAGICVVAGVVLVGLSASSPNVNAANNALSGWTIQGGDADWRVQPDGTTVKVVQPDPDFDNTNGPSSFFVSPNNVSGTFKVTMSADPELPNEEGDYMGFALGYQTPVNGEACTNDNPCDTDFYLFDWKKETEKEGGEELEPADGGQEGFSVMHVQGPRDLQNNNTPDHPACFWTHENVDGFCDAFTNFGPDKGWDFGVSYTFEVTYTPSLLKIVLKGTGGNADTTFFSAQPPNGTTFPAGRFAFYNYSQPLVAYAFDDGTAPTTTTTTTTSPTSTTVATTSTTAAGGGSATTQPTVGPAVRSTIVRTGQSSLLTAVQLGGGVALLMVGAILTAARGKRPEGAHFA